MVIKPDFYQPCACMPPAWMLQEDEIAVNVLTGGVSPYLALVLPSQWRPRLRSYLTFDDPDASSNADQQADASFSPDPTAEPNMGGTTGCDKPRRNKEGDAAVAPGSSGRSSAGASGSGRDREVAVSFGVWREAFTWFMKKVLRHACMHAAACFAGLQEAAEPSLADEQAGPTHRPP